MVKEFVGLMARVMVLGVPTVCVLNGITIAGGLFFAMAHDY